MNISSEKYVVEYHSHTRKDFKDVWNIANDYLEPSKIVSVAQIIERNRKNKDIHIFVKDINANKVVGEITILPLTLEQYNKFISNKLEDTTLESESLITYEDAELCYLWFSSIAIDKNYRDDKVVLSCLLKGMYNKIDYLLKKGIIFKNICAKSKTFDGQKFIESFLNLKVRSITEDGYKIYSFDNSKEIGEWFNKIPGYIEKYDKTYNNK